MKKLLSIFALALTTSLAFSQTARLQVIHNSADAAAAEVDIYLDNTLLLDNFAFRTATPFIDAPAGTQFVVGVAPANSTSVMDTIVGFPFTLTAGETYVVVADGIVSPTGYSPAQPFTLQAYAMGREAASTAGNTDVLVHHGSTDAPAVDVVEVGAGAGTIVDSISYTEFQGYLELGTADYILEIQAAANNAKVVTYDAPLSTLGLEDSALVVVASGFLDSTMNSNGPAFGLFVALPGGGAMIPLPVSVITGVEDIDASTNGSVYPNPTDGILNFNFEGNDEPFSLQVFSIQGNLVKSFMNIRDVNRIDLTDLETGMYQLNIFNDQNVILNRKITIVK